jgi:hypothetical protein
MIDTALARMALLNISLAIAVHWVIEPMLTVSTPIKSLVPVSMIDRNLSLSELTNSSLTSS